MFISHSHSPVKNEPLLELFIIASTHPVIPTHYSQQRVGTKYTMPVVIVFAVVCVDCRSTRNMFLSYSRIWSRPPTKRTAFEFVLLRCNCFEKWNGKSFLKISLPHFQWTSDRFYCSLFSVNIRRNAGGCALKCPNRTKYINKHVFLSI